MLKYFAYSLKNKISPTKARLFFNNTSHSTKRKYKILKKSGVSISSRANNNGFCPGTIVTWLNVRAAYELCEREGKEMRYSFGKPTEAYKDRWCERAPLGRTLSI
ncbi:hypothetical protein QZQ38_10180 [Serratia marcescens]|uniref:hypothetical protein n=1 Tax=Serratia marcescens TaxID=615 RepID=UPI00278E3DAD|nr:hypothetical protein [Serratia marcescens]